MSGLLELVERETEREREREREKEIERERERESEREREREKEIERESVVCTCVSASTPEGRGMNLGRRCGSSKCGSLDYRRYYYMANRVIFVRVLRLLGMLQSLGLLGKQKLNNLTDYEVR